MGKQLELLYFPSTVSRYMISELPKRDLKDGLNLLNQSIDSFNRISAKFELYYRQLEKKVEQLSEQIRIKNQQLELNLKEKEEIKNHLHHILESLPTGVIVIDLKGRITTFNRAAERITGFLAREVITKSFRQTFGSSLFSSLPLDLEAPKEMETQVYTNRKEPIYVKLSVSPVRNFHGNRVGTIISLLDITRTKKLEEQANRAKRLAAMGEMASKITHEIRNPLGSIELFVTLLKRELKDQERLRIIVDHISAGVRSIGNIVSNLLLFVRPQQKSTQEVIDLHQPLRESLLFTAHLLIPNSKIRIITTFSSTPLLVSGDPELLKQAALNIILNAIQAMPEGGTLEIITGRKNSSSNGTSVAEVKFMDTGIGIPKANQPKVFDPFFTTKRKGTGLGLTIVHNIVKAHAGTIELESLEGKGTTCTITLPLWGDKRSGLTS